MCLWFCGLFVRLCWWLCDLVTVVVGLLVCEFVGWFGSCGGFGFVGLVLGWWVFGLFPVLLL